METADAPAPDGGTIINRELRAKIRHELLATDRPPTYRQLHKTVNPLLETPVEPYEVRLCLEQMLSDEIVTTCGTGAQHWKMNVK